MARAYDTTGRAAAAAATRRRILDVARRVLEADGYQATTIATVAARAEVSPQTIYNAVGGKAELLKAAYDLALAGDDQELPMSSRPEFLAMAASADAAAHARAYAGWTRAIYERVGALLHQVLAHQGADPALTEFAATIDAERRTGNGHFLTALAERHGLPDHLDPDRAVDAVWVLTAPEVADRLVRRAGWSAEDYERWLGDQLVAALA